MSLVRPITRGDIKGPVRYGPVRDDYFWRVVELKRARRILIGDRVSLVFENRHTLSLQIEEICRVEGLLRDEQIETEIAVYNQLMPTESSLSATLFLEPPGDADRNAALQRAPGTELAVEIDHPNYRHRAVCREATRASLAGDYA